MAKNHVQMHVRKETRATLDKLAAETGWSMALIMHKAIALYAAQMGEKEGLSNESDS